jgi:hypothetical protein
MIKNQKQYEYSQELIKSFESSLSAIRERGQKKNDVWVKIKRDSLKSHLDALKAEIAEYEHLINHNSDRPIVLKLSDIKYLPQMIIKARIAAKISQKELAQRTGLTEEQIKEYEARDYQTASFLDFLFVLDALDIQVQKGEFLIPVSAFASKS